MTMLIDSLLWTSIEDTVSKCSEADGRVVMSACAVVKVDFQQADMIPYWRGNCGDKEED
jgi:hypothetical protein